MGSTHDFGFHFSLKDEWNTAWQVMWLLTSPIWAVLAFLFPIRPTWFAIWLGIFAVLFGIPEGIAIHRDEDAYPPLTHMIRHFLPDDFAFPLLYGVLGAAAARWLGVEPALRYLGVGIGFAILGWVTIHFTVTYARPDPHPHPRVRGEDGAVVTTKPAIKNPRPI